MKGFKLDERLMNCTQVGVSKNLSQLLNDVGFSKNGIGMARCLKEYDIHWNIHDTDWVPIFMLERKVKKS